MITNQNSKTILNGKEVANILCNKLKEKVELLVKSNKRIPGLSVVIVGENPASIAYVKNKEKRANGIGFHTEVHRLNEDVTEDKVISTIEYLNSQNNIDGILVQLPLPPHLNTERIINSISPNKDVDGLHPNNMGKLACGQKGLVPCTPKGIIEILHHYNFTTKGKNAVVIGRSNLVGKPISLLLLQEDATVTIVHSKTLDIKHFTKQADILICAIGKPLFIKKEHVKEESIIIDVGINKIADGETYKLVGDVDFNDVLPICKAITPVPGGIGQMTVAMLMKNTFQAYENIN